MPDVHQRIAQLSAELARHPGSAALLYELGGLKLAVGDTSGAIAAYQSCLPLAPDKTIVHNNLGIAQLHALQLDDAIASFHAALRLNPTYHRPLVNLGKALREAGRPREAIERLGQALRLQPDYPPALINLGDALLASGEPQAAAASLERAVALAPELVEARVSLAAVRADTGRLADGIAMLRAALGLAPDHAEAHLLLGKLLFASGDWHSAWPHFEYRFQNRSRPVAVHAPGGARRWDGSIPRGYELCLVGEQGLGDQIQFARYARVAAALGVHTTLMCESRLLRLLSTAHLADQVVALNRGEPMPGAHWVPLMSLPHWHRTLPDTVPASGGYLTADAQLIERWRAVLPRGACRVGLAWAGNPLAEKGDNLGRSPAFEALAPLASVSGVQFICLQKDPDEAELGRSPLGARLVRYPELDAGADAFCDTAAILVNIDLLITSDSALAHLGGALGVETWLCLKRSPDWRWMMHGDSTPWYESVRLFRQVAHGDWLALYAQVAAALQSRCARGN
jgi:tetratricopeptide (TPR) repeat protein